MIYANVLISSKISARYLDVFYYIGLLISPPQLSSTAPVTDFKQLISFRTFKTPKKPKINASLKFTISLLGINILDAE